MPQDTSGSAGILPTAEPSRVKQQHSAWYLGPGPPSAGASSPVSAGSRGVCTPGALPTLPTPPSLQTVGPRFSHYSWLRPHKALPSPRLAQPEAHEVHEGQAGSGRMTSFSQTSLSNNEVVPLHPTRGPVFFFVHLRPRRFKPIWGSVRCTSSRGLELPWLPCSPVTERPITPRLFLFGVSVVQSPPPGSGYRTSTATRSGRVSQPDQRSRLEATGFKIRADALSETGVKHLCFLFFL